MPRLKKILKNKYSNNIYTSLFDITTTKGLNRSTEINYKKLREKNKPHLTFQHSDKYQLLFFL